MSTDIVVNADLTKAIQDSLNPTDIRTVVQAELEKQGAAAAVAAADQATADKAAFDKLAADAAAAQTNGFTRTETIGGREFTFEASNELELERMVNNAYKVAYALQPTEAPAAVVDPAIAEAAAQKTAENAAIEKAELELKFKRGDISAAEYIEQSGAMKDYLAKQGVPLEALKAAVNQNQDAAESQSWAAAVDAFKQGPGADWPGGEKNLAQIGLVISSRPELLNATDKVAALAQAYASMKDQGLIFSGDDATQVVTTTPTEAEKTAAAKVVADKAAADAAAATAAAARKTPSTSSSLFGTSGGSHEGVSAIAPKGDVKVDPNASPEEIMDAWKKANLAAGKHPDDALRENYSTRRA